MHKEIIEQWYVTQKLNIYLGVNWVWQTNQVLSNSNFKKETTHGLLKKWAPTQTHNKLQGLQGQPTAPVLV